MKYMLSVVREISFCRSQAGISDFICFAKLLRCLNLGTYFVWGEEGTLKNRNAECFPEEKSNAGLAEIMEKALLEELDQLCLITVQHHLQEEHQGFANIFDVILGLDHVPSLGNSDSGVKSESRAGVCV